MKKNLFLNLKFQITNSKFQTICQKADLNVGSTSVCPEGSLCGNWVLAPVRDALGIIWKILAIVSRFWPRGMALPKSKTLLLIPLFLSFYSGCDLFNGSSGYEAATEEKQFVWNGLNAWYYWQSSVPNLADNRFSDDEALHNYLNGFSDERDLFDNLKLEEDDFSWFIEDYEEFEQSRQGISRSFGMRFGLVQMSENSNNLFGYVQYVIPGLQSPANNAGLKRGDMFTRINGTTLTINNYQSLLQNETYNVTLANLVNGAIQETNETVSIHSEVLQENPIYLANVLDMGSVKVGYLVLNAFRFNFHQELNEAFGLFKSENVDELILDLRYNGGGLLITSAVLAGMISGFDESTDFAELRYNDKKSGRNTIFPFYDRVPLYNSDGSFDRWDNMNQLSLHKLYVLTSRGTASASETLINGLIPFMEVELIGWQTVGKDEGSITVYDAPGADYSPTNSERDKINPNHMRAMQPIVFKIFNSSGQDYPDGFTPGETIREIDYLGNLSSLGDPDEPLLAKALEQITGAGPVAKVVGTLPFTAEMVMESVELDPFHDDMYLLPGDLERFSVPFK